MSGEALGRRLLRLDAAYCAGAGALCLVLVMPLARLLHAPPSLLAALGAAAIAWALGLVLLARRRAWRTAVTAVAAANVVAAAAVVSLAALAPAAAARLLLAAVAVEVGAFAAAQVAALAR